MKKRLGILFFLPFFLITTCSQAKKDLPPAPSHYYYDELGVLSEESKAYIDRINREIEEKTKAQLVVATIQDLEGADAFDYSVDLFNYWTIGDKDLENGLLLFLAADSVTGQKYVEIRTGYQTDVYLTDGKVGRIIDQFMMPSFLEGDLDQGIIQGFNALVSEIEQEYGVEITGDFDAYQEALGKDEEGPSLLSIFIFLAFMYFIRKHFIGNGMRYRGRGPRPPFGGFGGFSGGSSGGGFSGGGFSGGGGRTGGGGSGRSF